MEQSKIENSCYDIIDYYEHYFIGGYKTFITLFPDNYELKGHFSELFKKETEIDLKSTATWKQTYDLANEYLIKQKYKDFIRKEE